MKNFFKLSFTLMMFIAVLSACSNDDKVIYNNENESDLSNVDFQLKSFNNFAILFEYQDMDELRSKCDEAFVGLINEARNQLDTRTDITDIVTFVEITDGKAILREIYLINTISDTVVEGYLFNDTTGGYTSNGNGMQLNDRLRINGQCPSGYNLVKSCNNMSDDLESCVDGAISGYLTATLQGLGDCGIVRTFASATNVIVCSKDC